jgi:hypothetical protein
LLITPSFFKINKNLKKQSICLAERSILKKIAFNCSMNEGVMDKKRFFFPELRAKTLMSHNSTTDESFAKIFWGFSILSDPNRIPLKVENGQKKVCHLVGDS